jgi:hypothetical protein
LDIAFDASSSSVTVHIPRPFRRRASRGSWAA